MSIMIDLETLSVDPNATVIEVCAIYFDLHDTGTETFHSFVKGDDGDISEDTIRFHMTNGTVIGKGTVAPVVAKKLHAFLSRNRDQHIYCKGASFDFPILKNFFKRHGLSCPWDFRNEVCLRTVIRLAGYDTRRFRDEGIVNPKPHQALSDCIYQIEQLKHLNNWGLVWRN